MRRVLKEVKKTKYICLQLSNNQKAALLVKVKRLGFKQVRKLTHEDPAYKEAWDENGLVRSFSMSLSLLFDKPNEEEARNLEFVSKHS